VATAAEHRRGRGYRVSALAGSCKICWCRGLVPELMLQAHPAAAGPAHPPFSGCERAQPGRTAWSWHLSLMLGPPCCPHWGSRAQPLLPLVGLHSNRLAPLSTKLWLVPLQCQLKSLQLSCFPLASPTDCPCSSVPLRLRRRSVT